MREIVKPNAKSSWIGGAMRRDLIAFIALLFATSLSSAGDDWQSGDDCVAEGGTQELAHSKSVGPQLDSVTYLLPGAAELRALKRKFVDAAWNNANQAAASVGPPTNLNAAKARAGDKPYNDYRTKAASVALLVKRVTGNTVSAQELEPASQ